MSEGCNNTDEIKPRQPERPLYHPSMTHGLPESDYESNSTDFESDDNLEAVCLLYYQHSVLNGIPCDISGSSEPTRT